MISFPWDSVATALGANGYPIYDRHFTGENWRSYIQRIFTNGVFMDDGTSLQVLADTGLAISVSPGWCNILGTFGENDYGEPLQLEAGGALPRIDTVIARWDANLTSRTITLMVLKGEEAQTPVRPALTRGGSIWDIGIADIAVGAAAQEVKQINITDTRLETSRCGVVMPFMEIDTEPIFNVLNLTVQEIIQESKDRTDAAIAELEEQTELAVYVSEGALSETLAGEMAMEIREIYDNVPLIVQSTLEGIFDAEY